MKRNHSFTVPTLLPVILDPRSVILLLAAGLTSACFKYQTVQPVVVRAEEEVRVRISDDAAVRLAGHYGSITRQLEGQLSPLSTDSLLLAVWIGRQYTGTAFENARQRLSLGRQEVLEVRRREFSVTRTVIVTTGVLAVLGLAIHRIGFLENPNPPNGNGLGEPPDPNGVRMPILRIR